MTSLKQLWTLKSNAGMSDEDFRNLCYSFSQKSSTKDLSPEERDKVKFQIIKIYPHLKISKSKSLPRKRSLTNKIDGVFVLPSFKQKELARELIDSLHKISPSGITLETQSMRMYKKSFEKLSRFEVQGVIESIKGMIKRHQISNSGLRNPTIS